MKQRGKGLLKVMLIGAACMILFIALIIWLREALPAWQVIEPMVDELGRGIDEDVNTELALDRKVTGSLPDGISCKFSFVDCEKESGSKFLKKKLKVSGSRSLLVRARIKNDSKNDLDDLRMFCAIPGMSGGRTTLTTDDTTISCVLVLDDKKVAQSSLKLVGDTPFTLRYFAGDAGHVMIGGERREIPIYKELPGSIGDFWNDTGLKIDLPAGESCHVAFWLNAQTERHARAKTWLTRAGEDKSGSFLVDRTLFGRAKKFHITTEMVNLDGSEMPVQLAIDADGGKVIPESITVNGEKADTGVLAGVTTLGYSRKKGEVTTVEYDVEIAPQDGATTYISNLILMGSVPLMTYARIKVTDATLAVVEVILAIVSLSCFLRPLICILRGRA